MSTPKPTHQLTIGALFALVLLSAAVVFQQGLPGFFQLDDGDNLSPLETGIYSPADVASFLNRGKAGPTKRPISKLSFLIDDQAWPSDAETFKRTNILIHILCGCLVFAFCRLIFRLHFHQVQADWLALATTALWLLNPLQVSTVLYVVQRMTQLAALFTLCGLLSYTWFRLRILTRPRTSLLGLSASLAGFGLLATFSKENGALLVVYLVVLEFTVLRTQPAPPLFVWWRRLFLLLPAVALLSYLLWIPGMLPGYVKREFDLEQRLLTEPSILGTYLRAALTLTVHKLGLYQDDYPLVSDWTTGAFLVPALVGIAAVAAAARNAKRFPLIALAPLWFLGGHLLESTTLPLELYFEHRNYLPLLGIFIGLVVLVYRLLNVVKPSPQLAALPLAGFALVSGLVTAGYASEWSDTARLIPIWASEHPESVRAQRSFAQELARQGLIEDALDHLDAVYDDFPEDLSLPLMSIEIACQMNRPVRYSFDSLRRRIGEHRMSDGLRPALQNLAQRLPRNSCAARVPEFQAFMQDLPYIRDGELRPRNIAGFFVIDGELHLERGEGNAALEAFQIVNQLHPTAASALRIANFYILVGHYQFALEALDEAERRAQAQARPWKRAELNQAYAEQRARIKSLRDKAITAPSQATAD